MDFLKKAADMYQQSQQGNHQQGGGQSFQGGNNVGGGDVGVTGGAQWNAPHGSGGAGMPGGSGAPNVNHSVAIQEANQVNDGEDDSGFLSKALSFASKYNVQDADKTDEEKIKRDYDQAYNQGNTGNMSGKALGRAAGLKVFTDMFSSGGASATSGGAAAGLAAGSGGKDDMISKIMGMAMKEALKLFQGAGKADAGEKQDAVNGAAGTFMKLVLKSKLQGGGGMMGGANSGGLGGLMSMAQKFL